MVEKSELLRVPAFADLPDDQIAWFISQSQELHLKTGETYVRQGDPADAMFVVLEGQLEARGEMGGETVVFSIDAGQRHRSASVFQDEAVPNERASRHRKPRPALSGGAFSRTRAENAGAGQAARGSDVRSDSRNYAHRAAARTPGLFGKAFRRVGARTEQPCLCRKAGRQPTARHPEMHTGRKSRAGQA